MALRVVQWSTGHVGVHSLHGIITHPDLELVGLWVHSETKAGRDAGDLSSLPPTGVKATNDIDAILALDADCVCYTATADLRPDDAVADICRILASGANVVSSSLVQLLHPKTADQRLIGQLEAACKEGGTSCWFNGVDPGFANDVLPILLTGGCESITEIRVQEILNYDTYDQREVLEDTMGFGKPLDHTPMILIPSILGYAWGGVLQTIAEALDVTIERVDEVYEKAALDRDIHIPTGVIPAGTQAGLRFEVQGIVNGRPAIVVEHVTRLHDDVAPDWPHGQGYRITVTGNPNLKVDFSMSGTDGDHNTGGLVLTAMRIVNAIPAVCAAEPGMLSVNDLPLIPGRHLLQ
jgi:2,4-diaminopentanoate dehydrogenase